MKEIKIVGLGGASNRHASCMAALDMALLGVAETGAQVVRFDIHELGLPMYRYGINLPEVEPLIDAVRACDGMIWCTPLYHGSVPGSFKNAIDWFELLSKDTPPYLTNKVIGLMATAGGAQALQAINTMEFIVRSLRGWTLPLTMPIVQSDRAFDETGRARDADLAQRLGELGRGVVLAAASLRRG